MEPGRNPLIDYNHSVSQQSGAVPGKRPGSSSTSSDAYGKVKQGAGVAWDKTKQVSVAAAKASKPVFVAAKNGAVSLYEKTKNALSSKK
jgi:hypothetical protein